jgi:hypothetical protein
MVVLLGHNLLCFLMVLLINKIPKNFSFQSLLIIRQIIQMHVNILLYGLITIKWNVLKLFLSDHLFTVWVIPPILALNLPASISLLLLSYNLFLLVGSIQLLCIYLLRSLSAPLPLNHPEGLYLGSLTLYLPAYLYFSLLISLPNPTA